MVTTSLLMAAVFIVTRLLGWLDDAGRPDPERRTQMKFRELWPELRLQAGWQARAWRSGTAAQARTRSACITPRQRD
jgi:hypothetical protein